MVQHPSLDIFGADQRYVVFEGAFGGQDLEKFETKNAKEAKSILTQVGVSCSTCKDHS